MGRIINSQLTQSDSEKEPCIFFFVRLKCIRVSCLQTKIKFKNNYGLILIKESGIAEKQYKTLRSETYS